MLSGAGQLDAGPALRPEDEDGHVGQAARAGAGADDRQAAEVQVLPVVHPEPFQPRFHVRWPGRQLQQLWDRQPEQLLLQVPGGARLVGLSDLQRDPQAGG
uniref:Plakophilin 1 n=1 Tax=Rousettus aegyptiacus TaxID=9407 RepID=A0A7J8BAJ7_ROUAE|nr:plakophilin 1 [Rousettus aegyptiacus]